MDDLPDKMTIDLKTFRDMLKYYVLKKCVAKWKQKQFQKFLLSCYLFCEDLFDMIFEENWTQTVLFNSTFFSRRLNLVSFQTKLRKLQCNVITQHDLSNTLLNTVKIKKVVGILLCNHISWRIVKPFQLPIFNWLRPIIWWGLLATQLGSWDLSRPVCASTHFSRCLS